MRFYQEYTPTISINSPRPHQEVITKLLVRLYLLFETGQITLQPYPETMIDSGQSSPVPDLILVNLESEQAQIIIEIANKTGFKADCRKIRTLIDAQDYDIQEGFVYNYQTQDWYKYSLAKGEEKSSFSDIILQDFAIFLKRNL